MDQHQEHLERQERWLEFEDELLLQARFEPGSQHWPLKTRKVATDDKSEGDEQKQQPH